MDDEFLNQLQALLQQYDDRIKALETSVNDVLIGGWKKADAEYRDQEAYGKFNDAYGPELEKLKPYFSKLYGEDYDLPRGLYEQLKNTEGYGSPDFDEKGLMDAKIADFKDKFSGWNLDGDKQPDVEEVEIKEEPTEEETSKDEKENEIPSVDELTKIYKEYKAE